MKKKYSIKDIAKLSGVSVATVSRVINNNGRFSEETRLKVLKVIDDTGYQMNYSAKSLRMNKSFTIGILVPDIGNYFFSDIVQKIEEILFTKGYSTIICNTARNLEKEFAYLQMLESKGVDGLIVISGADEFGFDYSESEKNIPYICIDREPQRKDKTIYISSDHYQGAFDATEKLIKSGVKHPLIVLHKHNSPSSLARFHGFKDALEAYNISFSEHISTLKIDVHTNNLTNDLRNHLKEHPSVDGVFAINDTIALNILKSLSDINIFVPKDFKVIGFDNIPFSDFSSPTLSSVSQDTTKISEIAVKSLLSLIGDNSQLGTSILIPTSLSLKESTGD